MTATEYSLGIAYLIVTVASLTVIAVALRRRLVPGSRGAIARLVEVVFAISSLVVVVEVMGSFGGLGRASLPVVLAVIALTVLCFRSRFPSTSTSAARPTIRGVPVLLALGAVTLTAVHWAAGVQESFAHGIYLQDSAWYHLPFAASIYQSGDTWAVHFTDPMALSAWFYPQNSELLHAVGMFAFGTDFLSLFLNLGWLAVAFLAAWCIGRPAGLGAEAALAAALVLGTEMMQVQAGNAPNDIPGIALLLSSVAILLNAGQRGGEGSWRPRPGPLFAAALAAGLAIGTKITLLVPISVVTVGLAWLLWRRRPRLLGVWLGGVLVGGGYWYLRNLVHTGNPLPWIRSGPLPGPDQVSIYPRIPHSIADYASDPSVWAHSFAPALSDAIGPLWPLVLAGAAGGLLAATFRGPGLERVLGLAGIAAAVAYVFIPVSASGTAPNPAGFATNLRYLAPVLALGLVLLVLQLGRSSNLRRFLAPAAAAIFLVDSLTSWGWWPDAVGLGAVLALLLITAPLLLVAVARRGTGLLVAGLTVFLLLIVVGYPGERDYLRTRYRPALAPSAGRPGFRGTSQWRRLQSWAQSRRNATIGVVGPPAAFGQYTFYDSHLTNRVVYVGEPGPNGAYRPIDNCAAWRRAIDRKHLDYVVVTPPASFGPRSQPEESVWLDGERHAHRILSAAPAAVFQIEGHLDPRACTAGRLPPMLAVPGGGITIPPGPTP